MTSLNLACGNIPTEGVVDLDIVPYGDVQADMLILPFKDESFTHITCRHGIEHLEYPEEVGVLLAEVWRVLQWDGNFNVTCPNLHGVVQQMIDEMMKSKGRPWVTRNLFFGTWRSRWEFHKWMYTDVSLTHVLEKVFQDVKIEYPPNDHGGPGLIARSKKERKDDG